MKLILRPVLLAVLLLGLAAPSAQACLSAGQHTYTFFKEFREDHLEELLASAHVAKVRILNTQVGDYGARITTVQVIEPLKGLRRGDVFFVLSRRSSCEQDHGAPIGQPFFIAGNFDRGLFVGTWEWDREVRAMRRVDWPF